jgi:site-specific recombinase XerD
MARWRVLEEEHGCGSLSSPKSPVESAREDRTRIFPNRYLRPNPPSMAQGPGRIRGRDDRVPGECAGPLSVLPTAGGPGATPLVDTIRAFLLSREVSNASSATLRTYSFVLDRFCRAGGIQTLAEATTEAVEHHLMTLRGRMKPISVHKHFRTLRTFWRWCVRTCRSQSDPMQGSAMKVPKTLPRVPSDEDVRALLGACAKTLEGLRNRALIALAADSGLRKEEMRHLRIGDLDFTARAIRVHAGKGQKDGVTFFGETTASLLRSWLALHPAGRPTGFMFCTREGVQLGSSAIVRILYRLSVRARLSRKIGPHALRHYAATAILRRTGDLELVRRVLRHETLTMALRYIALAQTEVAAKYQRASPLDHLGSGPKVTRELAGREH